MYTFKQTKSVVYFYLHSQWCQSKQQELAPKEAFFPIIVDPILEEFIHMGKPVGSLKLFAFVNKGPKVPQHNGHASKRDFDFEKSYSCKLKTEGGIVATTFDQAYDGW